MQHTYSPGSAKAAMAAAGALKTDLWRVPREAIHRAPGFNPRVPNDDYHARVRRYADSLKRDGWHSDKPASGYAGDDGTLWLTDAYTRLDAYDLARTEGADLGPIPFVVKPKGTSEEDLTVAIHTGNDGERLTSYEQAILCKRMAAWGRDSAYIAQRMGYVSAQHVDNLLTLVSASLPMQRMVQENMISATEAIKVIKKHGADAANVVTAALARSSGGRVTAATTNPAAAHVKVLRKQSELMFDVLLRVESSECFSLLGEETCAQVTALIHGMIK